MVSRQKSSGARLEGNSCVRLEKSCCCSCGFLLLFLALLRVNLFESLLSAVSSTPLFRSLFWVCSSSCCILTSWISVGNSLMWVDSNMIYGFLLVTFKPKSFLWVTLKQKHPSVGDSVLLNFSVGNLQTKVTFYGWLSNKAALCRWHSNNNSRSI